MATFLVRPRSRQRLLDIPGFGVLLRQFVPEAPPERCLRYGVQLLDQRLDVLPFRSQGFAMAATRIGQKTIEAGDDLLYADLLQIRNGLVKLLGVFFGKKGVAAPLLLRLAGKLDGPQALPERSERTPSESQSPCNLFCRFLLEKKNQVS